MPFSCCDDLDILRGDILPDRSFPKSSSWVLELLLRDGLRPDPPEALLDDSPDFLLLVDSPDLLLRGESAELLLFCGDNRPDWVGHLGGDGLLGSAERVLRGDDSRELVFRGDTIVGSADFLLLRCDGLLDSPGLIILPVDFSDSATDTPSGCGAELLRGEPFSESPTVDAS